MSGWVSGFDHSLSPARGDLVFAYTGARLLVRIDGDRALVPELDLVNSLLGPSRSLYLGRLDDRGCFAVALEGDPNLPGDGPFSALGLRELFGRLPDPVMGVAGRAFQTVEWYVAHAYCGRCGAATELSTSELARNCPRCEAVHYPRITPAVIMLVHHEGRLLLARNRNFRGGFFSCLAGFVEPGETLEQAVAREVREEVGIEIDQISYFGSQAWPFPSQLMIGFNAAYRSGDIVLQQSEIMEADWFGAEDLPPLPGPFSIARRLIDGFLEGAVQTSRSV